MQSSRLQAENAQAKESGIDDDLLSFENEMIQNHLNETYFLEKEKEFIEKEGNEPLINYEEYD